MSIGENLKLLRKAKGLTQEQLGEKLGVTKGAVANWENGQNGIAPAMIPDVCNALGTDANILLGWDSKEKKILSAEESAKMIIRTLAERDLLDQVENLTDEQVKKVAERFQKPKLQSSGRFYT